MTLKTWVFLKEVMQKKFPSTITIRFFLFGNMMVVDTLVHIIILTR